MKKSGFADRQENTENTVFLFRLFILLTALAGVLQLCPFRNITLYIIPVCNLFLLRTAVRLAAKGTFKSYRQLYQPESEVRFRLYAVSVIPVYIFITAFSISDCLRDYENEEMLTYTDDIINYAAENSLMNRYAEIDDTIQKITSNPYAGKKQTNGADALWECCYHNSGERREEFSSVYCRMINVLKK